MKKLMFVVGGLALSLALFAVSANVSLAAVSITDAITPQNCARTDAACAFFLDTTSNGQIKWGGLVAGGLRSLTNFFVDGKVGVGTLAPSVGEKVLRLDVEGAIGAQFYCDQNGNNCVAGSDLGKGGSTTTVDIAGGTTINVVRNSFNNFSLSVSTTTIQARVTGTCAVGSAIKQINGNGTVECQSVSGNVGGDSFWASSTSNANNIFNRNSGNVGVGISAPSAKLHVNGDVKIEGNNAMEFGAGIAGKQLSAGKIGYHIFPALTTNSFDIVGAGTAIGNRLVRIFDNLLVDGDISATNICTVGGVCKSVVSILNASSTVIGADSWTTLNGNVYRANGNVGVGISAPTAKLHVNGDMKIEGNNALEFGAGIAGKQISAGKIGYKIFPSLALNSFDIVGAGSVIGDRLVRIFDDLKVEDAITSNSLTSNTICTTAGVCKSVVDILNASSTVIGGADSWTTLNGNVYRANGAVGIGTSAPLAKLDVVGNIRIADGTQGEGKVLVSDANGVASWFDLGSVTDGLSCTTFASVSSSYGQGDYAVNVPASCISEDGCTLKENILRKNGTLYKTRLSDYSQDAATNKWWSTYRPNGAAINGDKVSTPVFRCGILGNNGVCYLTLRDDKNNVETEPGKWTVYDHSNNYNLELQICTGTVVANP